MKRRLSVENGKGRGRGSTTPPAPRPRRWRLVGIVCVVLTLAAAIGSVYWLSGARTGQPSPSVEEEPGVSAAAISGPAFSPQATVADLKQVAIETTGELAASYPQSPDVWNVQAQLAFHLGNSPDATRLWEQCVAADAKSTDALYGLGFIACLEGANDKAVERFRAALAVNPGDVRIPLMLADCLTRLGKPDEAVPLLQECLNRDANSAAALLSLGQIYLDLKQYEPSRAAFENVLKLDPNNREAWFGLGRALTRLGEAEQAKQVMERFKSIVADERPTSSARVLSFDDIAKGREVAVLILNDIGKVYLQHENTLKAEESWLKASVIDPQGVKSRLELAALYEQSDRNLAALRVCEQLRDIEPRNAAYWSNVGVLKARLGRYDEAMAAVEEAIKLDPANPEYRHTRELIRSAQ